MSFSSKPILHGRDHRRGGADPIPNIGSAQDWCLARTSFAGTVPGDNTTTNMDLFLGFGSGVDSGVFTQYDGFVKMVQLNEPGTYEIRWTSQWVGSFTPAANQHLNAYAYNFIGHSTSYFGFGIEGTSTRFDLDPDMGTNVNLRQQTGGFIHWPNGDDSPIPNFVTSRIAVAANQNTGSNLGIIIETYIKRVDDFMPDPEIVIAFLP